MRPSIFNVRVPLPGGEVFLMNTLTDAQVRVSADVVSLLDRMEGDGAVGLAADLEQEDLRRMVEFLAEQGFVVASREAEREALEQRFAAFRDDTSEVRATVLTTMQCNFACGYCVQGDHAGGGGAGQRMTLATALRVADWLEARLERLRPRRFVLTFFGGEPLLNLPAVYYLAERLWHATQSREIEFGTTLITNGLLLTRDVVDRLALHGLAGVKVTLDGDRESHDRARPLRGGQGTFDRIMSNLAAIAGRCHISIGGNFDAVSVDRYGALLEVLRAQDFASSIAKVSFKPVIRTPVAGRVIPLTPVGVAAPAGSRTCGSGGGGSGGGGSACDGCHFVDEQMAFLRDETRRHGFPTMDGVHMGPCEIHRRHAYTIGPDGALYRCPGFTGDSAYEVGRVDDGGEGGSGGPGVAAIEAWRRCGDCAFIPVCAGGCTVAAHHELGDMHAPACHKTSFESALVSLAHQSARAQGEVCS